MEFNGQTGYTAHILDGIIDKIVRQIFEWMNADIIFWADMYGGASLEARKMIVNCLIRRVEVYRDTNCTSTLTSTWSSLTRTLQSV